MKINITRISLIFLFLFSILDSFAGKIPFSGFKNSSTISSYPSSTISIQDDQYGPLPTTSGFVNASVINSIEVKIDHTYPTFVPSAYSYIVYIRLEVWNSSKVSTVTNIELPIEYDPQSKPGLGYTDKSVYSFTGAHKVDFRVTNIVDKNTMVMVSNPEDNFVIKSNIEIERYFDFSGLGGSVSCPSDSIKDLNADGVFDELKLYWSAIAGAEEYDLEWTYVDDYGTTDLNTTIPIGSISWDFRNNSTRINTAKTHYTLSLTYDRGYIIYRLRGVGRDISNPSKILYGNWSLAQSGTNPSTCSYYNNTSHSSTLNWQYNAMFAEEGKKKELVTYFDGSLRDRQKVTKSNTENKALVGESIYDFTGRKAIEVLPVPVQDNTTSAIDYYDEFNTNLTGDQYSWEDFDKDPGSTCASATGAMNSNSGASNYYSSSNPNQVGKNAYIPHASNYPFIQTEYTPDNTNRIRRTSGVGINHIIGSNHETKYYYGQPQQIELDRLFGNEVGYVRHYKKNVVIDPNGQVSISYLDQEGRTIATGLANTNPSNVNALPNMASIENLQSDLFGFDANGKSLINIPNIESSAIEYNTQLLVSEAGEYTFKYSMEGIQVSDDCFQESICFDCIYDLKITITDECGQIVNTVTSRIGSPTLDNTCGSVLTFTNVPSPIVVNLPIGNYQVTKTLSVNEEAYLYYLGEYLKDDNNICIKSFETFVTEEKAKLDYTKCDITCDQCVELLGTRDAFVLSGKGSEKEWESEYKKCTAPCSGVSICEQAFEMMKSDMSPGGQYAEWYDSTSGNFDVSVFPLSILNDNNVLPDNGLANSNDTSAWWRHPVVKSNSTSIMTYGYFESDGITRSKIEIIKMPDGTTSPKAISTITISGKEYVYPENLVSVEEFISYWKPSWSNSLVFYHPEYSYIKWCFNTTDTSFIPYEKTSEEFDTWLTYIRSFTNATSLSLTASSGVANAILDKDPYFNLSPEGSAQKTTMLNLINNYYKDASNISIQAIAATLVNCPSYYKSDLGYPLDCRNFTNADSNKMNDMWQKYVMMYIGLKQKLQITKADDYVQSYGFNNFCGCIGVENFNAFKHAGLFFSSLSKPCSVKNYRLYKNKTRRYNLGGDNVEIDEDKARFNRYFEEKMCPEDKDFLNLLNELAQKGSLFSISTDLFRCKNFTPDLMKKMAKLPENEELPLASGSTYKGDWQWNIPSPPSSSCTIYIESFSAGIKGSINLNLTSISNVNNITSVVGLEVLDANYSGTLFVDQPFELTVIESGSSRKIPGVAYWEMDNCKFRNYANKSDFSTSLLDLMNKLANKGELLYTSGTGRDLESGIDYPPFVTRFIKNKLDNSANAKWLNTNTSPYKFTIQGGTNVSNIIEVEYTTISPLPNTLPSTLPGTFAPNDIKVFYDWQVDKLNLSNGFSVKADYLDGSTSGTVLIKGKVTIGGAATTDGLLATSVDPIPAMCDNLQMRTTIDFEALMNQIITESTYVDKNLLEYDSYTSLLESYIGIGSSTTLKAPVYDDTSIMYEIEVKNADNEIINTCYIELYRKNLDYYKGGNSFANLDDFGYLKGVLHDMEGNISNEFTAMVGFNNNDNRELIYGRVSCLPMYECPTCASTTPKDNILDCHLDYLVYLKGVSDFNNYLSSHAINPLIIPPVTPIPETQFTCTPCVDKYLSYINAAAHVDLYYYPSYPSGMSTIVPKVDDPGVPMNILNFSDPTKFDCDFFFDECEIVRRNPPIVGNYEFTTDEMPMRLKALRDSYNSDPFILTQSWFTPMILVEDDFISDNLDCNCIIKYILYLENWIGSDTNKIPDFAPVGFGQFKGQDCSDGCFNEYKFYFDEYAGRGGVPIRYTKLVDCDCWKNYGATGNIANPLGVFSYCINFTTNNSSSNFYPDSYYGIVFETPFKIQKKFETSMDLRTLPYSPCDFTITEAMEISNDCEDWLDRIAEGNARIRFEQQQEELTSKFQDLYYSSCLKAEEEFKMDFPYREYQFTLYYYDQAGNLRRTVPPIGVVPVKESGDLTLINEDRTNGTNKFYTQHFMQTVYEYNSLNQLIKQSVPDHTKMDRWFPSASSGIPAGFAATDVHFTSSNNGTLIGVINGATHIYQTYDGGVTWLRNINIKSKDLKKISMANANYGYGIGKGGLIVRTTDGGDNWVVVHNAGDTNEYNDVVVWINSTTTFLEGMIAGNYGKLFRINDNLASTITFTAATVSPTLTASDNVMSVSFRVLGGPTGTAGDDGFAVVSGSSGTYMLSCNIWSSSWGNHRIDVKTSLSQYNKSYSFGDSNFYAVGNNGVLIYYGLDQWTLRNTKLTEDLVDVYFKDVNNGMVMSSTGKLYKTTDAGNTFTQVSTIGVYKAMHFYDAVNGKGYAVGSQGLIARLDLMATQPVAKLTLKQNITNNFLSVNFFDANIGVIGAESGILMRVSSAGSNILLRQVTTVYGNLEQVYCRTPNADAAVVRTSTNVYHISINTTTNTVSGATTLSTSVSDFTVQTDVLYGLYSVGSTATRIRKTDISPSIAPVALTTNYLTLPSSASNNTSHNLSVSPNGTVIIVVGNTGRTHKYRTNWGVLTNKIKVDKLNAVRAITGTNNMYIAGNDGNLLYSTDIGAGFSMLPTATTDDLKSMDFNSTGNGFAISNQHTILTINGSTVTQNTLTNVGAFTSVMTLTGDDGLLATTDGNQLYKTIDGGITFTPEADLSKLLKGEKFIYAMYKNTNNNIHIAGTEGISFKYDNTLAKWSKVALCPLQMNDIHYKKENGIMGGVKGYTLYSTNSGGDWKMNPPLINGASYTDINGVYVENQDNVYLVGQSGLGITCKITALSPSSMGLVSVHHKSITFSDEGIGLVASTTRIHKKVGTGAWTPTTYSGINFRSVDIQGKYAIAVGENSKIYYSNNSGTSFTSVVVPTSELPASSILNKVVMYDYTRAYIAGDNGILLKTVDYGESASDWKRKYSDLNPTCSTSAHTTKNLTAFAITNRDQLFFAGSSGHGINVNDQADFASAMFWYDKVGRLTVSQNTKQFEKSTRAYGYSLYDAIGRVYEAGEKANCNFIETTLVNKQMDNTLFNAWLSSGVLGSRTEVMRTYYDEQFVSGGVMTQSNLRKRVASVTYEDIYDANNATFDNATHYSYDVHGNVNHLVQDIFELGAISEQYRHLYYQYDLISGKVIQVDYSPGKRDEFHHRYVYDAENRITEVQTSKDNVIWNRDARYEYYLHGPLARTEIGDLGVQGMDYSYTVHGWLKGVNSNTMNETRDPGRDGDISLVGNTHTSVARDVFGFTLGYYEATNKDYAPIGTFTTAQMFEASLAGSTLLANRNNMWNGNISHMVTCIPIIPVSPGAAITASPIGNAYKYDQLNRLSGSRSFVNINTGTNTWNSGGSVPTNYASDYTFDAMGNILTQKRNGHSSHGGVNMEDLTYRYLTEKGKLKNNRLYLVDDAVATTVSYPDDIEDQGTFDTLNIATSSNYTYDQLGNLTKDVAEGITLIEWTVSGKIKRIQKTGSEIIFKYDAMGNRICKIDRPNTSDETQTKKYYYVRDAQGNPMATYLLKTNAMSVPQILTVTERNIYGSSRLGMETTVDTLYYSSGSPANFPAYTTVVKRKLGKRQYELSNHLGNVLATISDKKEYVASTGMVSYFNPEILTVTDYYPFGSPMPGRVQVADDYSNATCSTSVSTTNIQTNAHTAAWTTINGAGTSLVSGNRHVTVASPNTNAGIRRDFTAASPIPGSSLNYNVSMTVASQYNNASISVKDQWGATVSGPHNITSGGTPQSPVINFADNGSSYYRTELTTNPPPPGTTTLTPIVTDAHLSVANWTGNSGGTVAFNPPGNNIRITANAANQAGDYTFPTSTGVNISVDMTVVSTIISPRVVPDPFSVTIYRGNGTVVYSSPTITTGTFSLSGFTFSSTFASHYIRVRLVGSGSYLPSRLAFVNNLDISTVVPVTTQTLVLSQFNVDAKYTSTACTGVVSGKDYKFGFNGMEKDNEIKGKGNSYDFGARIYDSRLGRFLSVDPWVHKYPSWSSYNAFMDNPVLIIDPTGKGGIVTLEYDKATKKPYLKVTAKIYIYKDVENTTIDLHQEALNMEDNIEMNWNAVTTVDAQGNQSQQQPTLKIAGFDKPLKVVFDVTVVETTKEKLKEKIDNGEIEHGDNLVKLNDGGGSNMLESNSGWIDVAQQAMSGNTYAHEFGHLLYFINIIAQAQNNRANVGTEGSHHSNERSTPLLSIMASVESTIAATRVVTQSDIEGLNQASKERDADGSLAGTNRHLNKAGDSNIGGVGKGIGSAVKRGEDGKVGEANENVLH